MKTAKHTKAIERFFDEHPEWLKDADLVYVPPSAREVVAEFPDSEGMDILRDENAMSSFGVTKLANYVQIRRTGETHRWALMLASQSGPALNTDSMFFQGMPRLYEQFGSQRALDHVLKAAAKHGFKPNPTDIYQPGLARFKGDPEAFVPATGGRGYIKKLCETRGWAVEGAVKVAARQPESDPLAPEKCVPLADDLVRARMRTAIAKNPELGRKPKELRAAIIAKHGSKG